LHTVHGDSNQAARRGPNSDEPRGWGCRALHVARCVRCVVCCTRSDPSIASRFAALSSTIRKIAVQLTTHTSAARWMARAGSNVHDATCNVHTTHAAHAHNHAHKGSHAHPTRPELLPVHCCKRATPAPGADVAGAHAKSLARREPSTIRWMQLPRQPVPRVICSTTDNVRPPAAGRRPPAAVLT
jgi:hypothetical protein